MTNSPATAALRLQAKDSPLGEHAGHASTCNLPTHHENHPSLGTPSTNSTITYSRSARYAAIAAGLLLVAASGAINVSYAIGKHTDDASRLIWAGIALASAVGLAAMGPALVASARARSIAGIVLALLGLVIFGGYNLTAALGSAGGSRIVAEAHATGDSEARARTRKAYDAAVAELAALPASKPAAELRSLIDAKTTAISQHDCARWLPDRVRNLCDERARLSADLGRAERREALQAQLAGLAAKLDTRQSVANTDAQAIVAVLVALGFSPDVQKINVVLSLLAVTLLEFGGSISFAVATLLRQQSFKPHGWSGHARASRATASTLAADVAQTPAVMLAEVGSKSAAAAVSHDSAQPVTRALPAPSARTPVEQAIVAEVAKAGGTLKKGQRGLAALLDVSPATINRGLAALVAAGAVAVSTSQQGTLIRLVG